MRKGFCTRGAKSLHLLWGLVDLSWHALDDTRAAMVTVASAIGVIVTVHEGHGAHVEVGLRVLWVCISIDFALYPELP
jgi:hypothetical protein